jgi:hypothetical protein
MAGIQRDLCKTIRTGLQIFPAIACVLMAFACGDGDPSESSAGLGPGPNPTTGTAGPSNPPVPVFQHDAGPGFRDPDAGDAGCKAPNMICSGACVATGSDPDHCGNCDTKCIGPTATCLGGQCACGPGFDYCAGTGCMDVSTDTNNCGACGNVCDPNQFDACMAGQCVATQ